MTGEPYARDNDAAPRAFSLGIQGCSPPIREGPEQPAYGRDPHPMHPNQLRAIDLTEVTWYQSGLFRVRFGASIMGTEHAYTSPHPPHQPIMAEIRRKE